jgi:protein tyrosine phosphatase
LVKKEIAKNAKVRIVTKILFFNTILIFRIYDYYYLLTPVQSSKNSLINEFTKMQIFNIEKQKLIIGLKNDVNFNITIRFKWANYK